MDNQLKKYIKDNYIPKKVIEDKMKELEKELFLEGKNRTSSDKDIVICMQLDILNEILQENMEEENYNHIPRID